MKSVVILGSGNVAENLAIAVASTHYRLLQVYARNTQRALQIASLAGCIDSFDPKTLAKADIYIIAVSDRAISEIANSLDFPSGSIVAHTAGSANIDELPGKIENRGVFYPLQTFSSLRHVEFKTIPIFVEGSSELAERELMALAHALSGSVSKICYEQRLKLHLAAVFACNFANHMYAIAQSMLIESGLDPKYIAPLIMETATKATACEAEYADTSGGSAVEMGEAGEECTSETFTVSAIKMQTGPAVRGDMQTQQRHLDLLQQQTKLQDIYKQLSLNIWETSKKI